MRAFHVDFVDGQPLGHLTKLSVVVNVGNLHGTALCVGTGRTLESSPLTVNRFLNESVCLRN